MEGSRLVIGLGNVGERYERTRHNLGFFVADALAKRTDATFTEKKKLHAFVAITTTSLGRTVIAKPTTYMNLSGEAVSALVSQERPSAIFVIYDDADLPFGEVRVRVGGGSAGHNGIKSLIKHLGADGFTRVRVGIGRPENTQIPLDAYVLSKWTAEEEARLPEIVKEVLENKSVLL